MQQADEDSVCHPVAIETKTVGARIGFTVIFYLHSIVCSGWIRYSRAKRFCEDRAIIGLNTALRIHIKLRKWDSLAQRNLFALMVFERDLLGLIPASPNNKISLVDKAPLFLVSRCLDELNSSLASIYDSLVKVLGVASQARVRVKVTVLSREYFVTKVCIAILFCLIDRGVEHADPVSVQYFYAAHLKMLGEDAVIEIPVLVLKVAETFASTAALYFHIMTNTTVPTIGYRF